MMTQPAAVEPDGAATPASDSNDLPALPSKRRRHVRDDGDEHPGDQGAAPRRALAGNQSDLVNLYFEVLTSLDTEPSILKRPLSNASTDNEHDAKRPKSLKSPPARFSVSDKLAAGEYVDMQDIAADILSAVKAALSELESKPCQDASKDVAAEAALRIREFKNEAMRILQREMAYPKVAAGQNLADVSPPSALEKSEVALSVVGYGPQEKRLFSSLPLSSGIDLSQMSLPPGLSFTRVVPSSRQERRQTLGELFAAPRLLPPLQPPKQPKTQAKGNVLDFYHPELTDTSEYPAGCYYTAKLTAGHYLDYSNATPSSQKITKQRERAQSLAGKKPSASELEMTEMEALFRGAFSSFAPCKDDTAAVVPSSVAGRIWWQKSGQASLQRMIEIEYRDEAADVDALSRAAKLVELDEEAVQEAIDNWDESAIDPSLEDVMGCRKDGRDKEADEILGEVSDMIEMLASYQRIRNLTLPNSQNRQSSDPVPGDMLATPGPQPSEEEQTAYQVLKAQLALIIKTLPPYAVAKLNGDQLDDLLISTKVQVQTDQYRGVMEEDEAGIQARQRAQQQAQQQVTQANARLAGQRTPSSMSTSYGNKFPASSQYGTPTRPQAHPSQYYRPSPAPLNYQQQPRSLGPPAHQARPLQSNQYGRSNGYPNQYATQLAKAQTPYGHQNMPQYASQPRPQYAQMQPQAQAQPPQLQQGLHLHPTPHQHQHPQLQPQSHPHPQHPHLHPQQQHIQPPQTKPNARFAYPQNFPQQPGTPGSVYTNGTRAPARTMSPQVTQRLSNSPSPSMQHNQRYAPTGQGNVMASRHPSHGPGQPVANHTPGLTGYHTVISEAQQQRILEQAKARAAAQERSAMFTDRVAQPGPGGMNYGAPTGEGHRGTVTRANMAGQQQPSTPMSQRQGTNGIPGTAYVPPHKVTPVPVPIIPGSQQQRQQGAS